MSYLLTLNVWSIFFFALFTLILAACLYNWLLLIEWMFLLYLNCLLDNDIWSLNIMSLLWNYVISLHLDVLINLLYLWNDLLYKGLLIYCDFFLNNNFLFLFRNRWLWIKKLFMLCEFFSNILLRGLTKNTSGVYFFNLCDDVLLLLNNRLLLDDFLLWLNLANLSWLSTCHIGEKLLNQCISWCTLFPLLPNQHWLLWFGKIISFE